MGRSCVWARCSGCRQIALAKQRKHLRGSNLGHALHEVMLAHGLLGLRQHGGRAGHIAPGQFQAGQEHLADNESVNHAVILPRQLQALLSVLLSGIQIVPFVEYAGQAKIRFAGIRRSLIAKQLQERR